MTQQTRWLRFNLVGIAGCVIQMIILALLTQSADVPASLAVTLAVLAAVFHNFLWHERVTWPGQPREGRWRRWLCFNLSTGVVSVVTNVIVTALVIAATGASVVVANIAAVISASLLNFLVSDRLVLIRRVA